MNLEKDGQLLKPDANNLIDPIDGRKLIGRCIFKLNPSLLTWSADNKRYFMPATYGIQPVYTIIEEGKPSTYRYFTSKSDSIDPRNRTFKPSHIEIIGGKITANISNDPALVYFLLRHPSRGMVFYLENLQEEAGKQMKNNTNKAKVAAMINLPEHPDYITEEDLTEIANMIQIPNASNLSEVEIRAKIASIADQNPVKFLDSIQSKRRPLFSLIREAVNYNVITFDHVKRTWFYKHENGQIHPDPLFVVARFQEEVQALANFLDTTDRENNLKVIKETLADYKVLQNKTEIDSEIITQKKIQGRPAKTK